MPGFLVGRGEVGFQRAIRVISVAVFATLLSGPLGAQLRVSPAELTLDRPDTLAQLAVIAGSPATFRSLDPSVAAVDANGVVEARGAGKTRIVVTAGETLEVPVRVEGADVPISFRSGIMPILTKAGCNSVACHSKKGGENGFYLSFFGSDPRGDYETIAHSSKGRRVSPAQPDGSLMLLKATGVMPHGGSVKIEHGGAWYRRIHRWIAGGAGYGDEGPPERIEVEPAEMVLDFHARRQLRVTAVGGDGKRRCVTVEAEYESNVAPIAEVDASGRIEAGESPGEATILVRYLGKVAVCRVTLPQPNVRFERPPEHNFIDRLVWDKLQRLGVAPSEPADDATFLRRAYLDTIGTLPTADEARAFLKNPDRAALVDALLAREEYALYWAMRWSDLLRVDTTRIGTPTTVAVVRWLRRQFRENVRYDDFVRSILTARGRSDAEGPAAAFHALGGPQEPPGDLGAKVSQLFLGVRIDCAKCHPHPSENWTPRDYTAFGGFFTGVTLKDTTIVPGPGNDLEKVPTAALGAPAAKLDGVRDRRAALADWITAPDNPTFARLIANRLWAHYFGQGLIEPVDDLRSTNPAGNEPLLDALAKHLRDLDYDLKAFTRTLLASRVYALSAVPNESNRRDRQNFSHAAPKPVPAEVLLDAISRATGVPERFNGWPEGYRAVDMWDNRMPSYFFEIFGRPKRLSVCACERGTEPSIAQALYLMNSPEVAAKISHRRGLARTLADSEQPPREIVDTLYLTALSRFPTDEERGIFLDLFDRIDRRRATEDTLWTVMNTKRFIYVH